MSEGEKTIYKYEVAAMYNVSRSTLYRWLEPHLLKLSPGYKKRHYVVIADLLKIYEILGKP